MIPATISTGKEGTRHYSFDLTLANSCELLPDFQVITNSVQRFNSMPSVKYLTHESVLITSILKMLLGAPTKSLVPYGQGDCLFASIRDRIDARTRRSGEQASFYKTHF